MTRLTIVCALVFTSITANAEANKGYYAGALYNYLTLDTKAKYYDDPEFNLSAITPYVGYKFNDYVALEARLGVGVSEEKTEYGNPDVNIENTYKLDTQYGVIAKGTYPVAEALDVFVFGGYIRSKYKMTASYLFLETGESLYSSGYFSLNGVSLGAGVSYELTSNWSVRAEWQYFDNDEVASSDSYNLGFSYQF